ncbi:MAG: TonB-dependent receptor [Alphaproteobacteria bacterium]|nr:TonB-dependent receptor [Alphaproteobacteria bacterium]
MKTIVRRLLSASAIAAVLAAPAFAAAVSGRVIDSTGQAALEGAEITLVELGRSAESGPGGAFRFADVAPGSYTLRAAYAGAESVDVAVTVTAEGDVVVDVRIGPDAGDYGESVIVVGQRANLASSISRQRAADGVESVLTRDAIGQFPDQNVAEAVRRAPGVNILNDQGEGRFIAVRGLDPDLNAATVNGARVPAPESDIRAVALDVIPSELIESIEIKKTLTPDMDADTIGASIEINTTSAFDREGAFYGATIEGSYNDATEKASPKGAFDFSTVIDGRVGVSGGVSYYQRRFATDNIEAEGWDTTGGIALFEKLEYRDYDVERTRIGLSLGLDYKASENTTLYIRGLHSIFEDQESRRRLTFDMGDIEPFAGDSGSADYRSDDERIRVERDLKDRFERQLISSVTAGGETFMDAWKIEYAAAWSKASEKENGSTDPIEFRRDFEDPGEFAVGFRGLDGFKPTYAVATGLGAFLDPEEYEFEKFERTSLSLAEDEELSFNFDIAREFALESGSFELQFGAKARMRQKTYDLQLDVYDGFDGDFTLADILGRQDYDLALIDPVPGVNQSRRFIGANFGDFELNDLDTLFESVAADYDVEEDIYAFYLLGRYETADLRVIGGVRVEHTRNDVRANLVEFVEEGAIRDGEELDEDTIFITPTGFAREYTDWLPSLSVRYDAAPDVVLRAGVFRSVVRPRPGQMAPRFLIEENDDNEREGEFGNPDLEPYKAWNFDAAAEWYFSRNAVVSAGVFYKSIENFIVEANFDNVTFNGIFADEALIPINGDDASVFGVEFNVQSELDFLPEPFDGLLAGFNYTYTDATGDLGDREIPLPAASKHTFNAMLGYEKDGFSARLAASYRAGYLDEVGGGPDEDRYVKDHLQWDVTVKYRITPKVQLFGEFINISDEPYIAYQKGPDGERLLQYEEYSWTAKGGVRLTF